MGRTEQSMGAFDVKTHFAQVLDRVEHGGERIVVTRHGKAVAEIVPVTPATDAPTLKDLLLNGPSLEGVDLERDRSLGRDIEL